MSWVDDITNSMEMNPDELREMAKGREAWRAAVHGGAKSQIRLRDWKATATNVGNEYTLLLPGGPVDSDS